MPDDLIQLKAMFYDIMVLRHPGHGNQKVHGNRFGPGQAKESLRRLKDDKAARERYKETARSKSGNFTKADKDKFSFNESMKMVKDGRIGPTEIKMNLDAIEGKIKNYQPFYGDKKDLKTQRDMIKELYSEAKHVEGKRIFDKIKYGGEAKLKSHDGELDVDVSVKTFGGAYGLGVKRPNETKYSKHRMMSTNDIVNYFSQFGLR